MIMPEKNTGSKSQSDDIFRTAIFFSLQFLNYGFQCDLIENHNKKCVTYCIQWFLGTNWLISIMEKCRSFFWILINFSDFIVSFPKMKRFQSKFLFRISHWNCCIPHKWTSSMGNYVKVTGKWLFSLCKPINEKRNMIPAIEKGLKAAFFPRCFHSQPVE